MFHRISYLILSICFVCFFFFEHTKYVAVVIDACDNLKSKWSSSINHTHTNGIADLPSLSRNSTKIKLNKCAQVRMQFTIIQSRCATFWREKKWIVNPLNLIFYVNKFRIYCTSSKNTLHTHKQIFQNHENTVSNISAQKESWKYFNCWHFDQNYRTHFYGVCKCEFWNKKSP